MGELNHLSPAAHAYAEKVPAERWASYLEGPFNRRRHFTNNVSESFNASLETVRDKGPLEILLFLEQYTSTKRLNKLKEVISSLCCSA